MSAGSWIRKYYPHLADSDEATQSDLAAARHSLRKWKGLRPAALRRHGCELSEISNNVICPSTLAERVLQINSRSCALCQRYDDECSQCPLYETLGGRPCDQSDHPGTKVSPWRRWAANQDPEPMILALRRTVWRCWWNEVKRKVLSWKK